MTNVEDPEGLFIDGPTDAAGYIPDVDFVKKPDTPSAQATVQQPAPVPVQPAPTATVVAQAPAPTQTQTAVAQASVPVQQVAQALPPQMQAVDTESAHDDELNALMVGDTPVSSMKNTFYDALDKSKQAQFRASAKKVLREFLKDDNAITNFGIEVLNDVNATVDQILENEKKAKIPEVDDILVNANRELDNFSKKNQKAREKAEKDKNWLSQWISGSKRAVEDYAFNAQDLVKKFEAIDAKIIAQSNELAKTYYQSVTLQEQNRKSANKMVGVLAMLEVVHMEALHQADLQQKILDSQEPNSPEWQTTSDRLRRLADVANAIEQQHANYMARLAVAWATTEQIRSSIRLSAELVRKLKMTSKNTIPTMKLIVAQIGQMNRMQKAGQSINALQDAQSHVIDVYTKNMSEALPKLEAAAQRPAMSAEEITRLAESVKKSNDDIVNAIKEGRKQRLEMEDAVIKAGQTIQQSSEEMGKQLVASLLGKDEMPAENTTVSDASAMATKGYDPESTYSQFGF